MLDYNVTIVASDTAQRRQLEIHAVDTVFIEQLNYTLATSRILFYTALHFLYRFAKRAYERDVEYNVIKLN